jgi:hypothetical protein
MKDGAENRKRPVRNLGEWGEGRNLSIFPYIAGLFLFSGL